MLRNESRRGGTLAVTIAALLPTFFSGWLVYAAMHAEADSPGGGPLPTAAGKTSATPSGSAARLPLQGRTVVIDPGHNPGNARHTAEIDRLVGIGTNRKECDTTGTSTKAGYSEASFALDVSRRARAILAARGAKVTLTQNGDRPFGPCVDERARFGNAAHADAVVSVHADGAAVGARGFHVILPASVHAGAADTRPILASSRRLGDALRTSFAKDTGAHFANYLGGGDGTTVRGDLGGLNLSTVPKVFLECGNMRDARDAAALTDPDWRQRAAEGIADGITAFLLDAS